MLYSVQLALLLVVAAVSANVIDINAETDKALISLDRQLTEKGYGIKILPGRPQDELGTHGGVVIGLNSLMRTKNCTVNVTGPGMEDFDFHLGFRLLAIAKGKIRHKDALMSGITSFNENSIHMSFTVKNFTDSCTVTLRDYKIEALGEVMFYGSLEKYDGIDITKFANKFMLPRFNAFLDRSKPRIQEHLQEDICRNLGTHIDDLLNVFFIHQYHSYNHVDNYDDNSIN